MIKYIGLLILIPTLAIAGAKTIGPTKDYSRQQKIQRGDITKEYRIRSLRKTLHVIVRAGGGTYTRAQFVETKGKPEYVLRC